MGRLTKQGIDYFSLDCQFENKVELYLLEKEAIGLAVMVTIWQLIYRNEGYYIPNGKDLYLLIKKRINTPLPEIESCIKLMIERDIFSKEKYEKYKILTSSGVQKRFFDAAKKKKQVRFCKKYLLISIDSYGNAIDSDGNAIDSVGKYTKVKVKEKVKVNKKRKKILKKENQLLTYLGKKITSENLTEHKNKITEFFNYRQTTKIKGKKQPYKTETGINGLFRALIASKEKWHDLDTCLDIAMEREWLIVEPEYYRPEHFKSNSQQKTKEQLLKEYS